MHSVSQTFLVASIDWGTMYVRFFVIVSFHLRCKCFNIGFTANIGSNYVFDSFSLKVELIWLNKRLTVALYWYAIKLALIRCHLFLCCLQSCILCLYLKFFPENLFLDFIKVPMYLLSWKKCEHGKVFLKVSL